MTPYFNVAVITFAAFLIGLGIIYGLQVCVERQQGGSKGRGGYGGTAGYEGRGSDVSQITILQLAEQARRRQIRLPDQNCHDLDLSTLRNALSNDEFLLVCRAPWLHDQVTKTK